MTIPPTAPGGPAQEAAGPMVEAEPAVRLVGLEKRYGKDVLALSGLDLELPRGAVGLLGPNGAGKTTLIKLLLGLVRPTAGEARIAGFDPRRRRDRLEVRRVVGYMPEGDCLLPGMTGVELVSTLGRMTGLSGEDAMTRAHEVLDYVELEEERYRGLEEYSTGMKQRLKLAQALVHDPGILLLDEPTNGLDPRGRRHMLTLIRDLGHARGKDVLLCSHLLHDVERTCDHVVVLHRGRAVESGRIADLTGGDGLRMAAKVSEGRDALAAALRAEGCEVEVRGEEELSLVLPPGSEDADRVFALAASTGAVVSGLSEVRSSLEQVFLNAVGLEGLASASSVEEVSA